MKKILTSVFAVVIGAAWILGPAAAQTTQPSTSDKMENKAEHAKDKAESKSESTMDKVKDKTGEAKDKVKEKAHEAKEKIVETKDKVVDKMKGRDKDKTAKAGIGQRADQANVRSAQQALKEQGFDPGPIDGKMGPRTSAALRDYQTKQGLTASGQLDEPTMDKLGVRAGAGASAASPTTEPQTAAPAAQKPKQSP